MTVLRSTTRLLLVAVALVALVALATAVPATAAAAAYDVHPTLVRLTYEELSLPGDESMGLLGGGYLMRPGAGWQVGFASYGAARGRRGGFFTGGLALAYDRPLGRSLLLEAGLFAGAGGGGSAPQGGGLMLRPHLELALILGDGTLGVGWSRVEFPNGDIASDQAALSFTHAIGFVGRAGWDRATNVDVGAVSSYHLRPQRQRLRAVLHRVLPFSGTRGTHGGIQDGASWLTGAAWSRDLGTAGFTELEAAGSMGGPSDGFAKVSAGLGVRLELSSAWRLELAGRAGLAGGGRVDTGGGIIADAGGLLEAELGGGFLLGVGGGVTGALDGDFAATRVSLGVGHAYDTPVPTGGWRVPGDPTYAPRRLRLRLANQWEQAADGALRSGGAPDEDIALLGLKADAALGGPWLLTGQALAAWDGDAGGYAMGLAGFAAEWELDAAGRWAAGGEMLAGAAGGGGIEVDGGLVAQATAGVGRRLGEALALWARYGRNGPMEDPFARGVVALELAFRFTTLSR